MMASKPLNFLNSRFQFTFRDAGHITRHGKDSHPHGTFFVGLDDCTNGLQGVVCDYVVSGQIQMVWGCHKDAT